MIYLCEFPDCAFLTRWKSEFETHRKRHLGQRDFGCQHCGKRFFCTRDLNIHGRVHSGTKPYQCRGCDRTFAQKSQLNTHETKTHPLLTNRQQKWFPCHLCTKRLATQDGLQIHIASHLGLKPHVCASCGLRFSSRSNLRAHSTRHEPHMGHECPHCGKSFRLKTMLKEHLWSHTGYRPHHCTSCGRGFKRKQQLEAHLNVHSGSTPFNCQDCGSKFKSSSRLSHHKNKCQNREKLKEKSPGNKTQAGNAAIEDRLDAFPNQSDSLALLKNEPMHFEEIIPLFEEIYH